MNINKLILIILTLYIKNLYCANVDDKTKKEMVFITHVEKGQITEAEKLLKEGVDVNCKDNKLNMPAIMWAVKHPRMVYLLLMNGANIYVTSEKMGPKYTIFKVAQEHKNAKSIALLNRWVKYINHCKNIIQTRRSEAIHDSKPEILLPLADIISQYCNYAPNEENEFLKYLKDNRNEFPAFPCAI